VEDEFYIGYEPSMPPKMSVRVRWAAGALLALGPILAGILMAAQTRASNGTFDYGHPQVVEGWLVEHPYPALVASDDRDGNGWYWLVGPGKHGAADLVDGLDGRRVRLSGTLIERGDQRMLEVVPGTLVTTSAETHSSAPARAMGKVTLAGEIVDSKCHLGVMKPGEGPTHRDCAVRCLLGRVPPMLDTHDRRRVPIVVADRDRFEAALPSLVGRPVHVHGMLMERDGQQFLMTTVHDILVD